MPLRPLRLLLVLLFGWMTPALGQAVQVYDVVVIGQNDRGIQAASAAAALGRKTVLIGYPAADLQPLGMNLTRLTKEEFRPGTEGGMVLEGLNLRQIRTTTASGEVNAIEGRVFIDCSEDRRLQKALAVASRDTSETFKPLVVGGDQGPLEPAPFGALVADSVVNLLVPMEAMSDYPGYAYWARTAGIAAAISIKQMVPLTQVEPRQIQAQLLEDSVTIFPLDDMPRRNGGKAWAGAQLIALYNGFSDDGHTQRRFGPDSVMPPRRFEAWWPPVFPTRGMPGPIYQPASRRDAAETVWQFFKTAYLNPKPKPKASTKKPKTKN